MSLKNSNDTIGNRTRDLQVKKVRGDVCRNLFKKNGVVNNIFERIWKETVVAHFEVISWNFAVGTDENDEFLI